MAVKQKKTMATYSYNYLLEKKGEQVNIYDIRIKQKLWRHVLYDVRAILEAFVQVQLSLYCLGNHSTRVVCLQA